MFWWIPKGEDGMETVKRDILVLLTGGTQSSGGEKVYPMKNTSGYNGTNGSFGKGGTAATNTNHGSGGGG